MLEIHGLTTRYGAISALRNVSLSVGANEVVGLIGPNGAGKTTLLNSVAGLLKPAEGSVHLDGRSMTGSSPDAMLRAGLALVPEHRRLFAQFDGRRESQDRGHHRVGCRARSVCSTQWSTCSPC